MINDLIRYDLEFKNEFWFEKSHNEESLAKLPLRFVWGVLAEDNGNYLDPTAKGSLVVDPTFNMAAPESQQWLMRFCKDLRQQPFYQTTLGLLLHNCFIETFHSWMERRCEVPLLLHQPRVLPKGFATHDLGVRRFKSCH